MGLFSTENRDFRVARAGEGSARTRENRSGTPARRWCRRSPAWNSRHMPAAAAKPSHRQAHRKQSSTSHETNLLLRSVQPSRAGFPLPAPLDGGQPGGSIVAVIPWATFWKIGAIWYYHFI